MSSGRDKLPPMSSGNGNLHLVLRWLMEMTGKNSTRAQKTLVFVIAAILLVASVALVLAVSGVNMRWLPVAAAAGSLCWGGVAGMRRVARRVRARRLSKPTSNQQQQVTDCSGGDGEEPADQGGEQVRDGST